MLSVSSPRIRQGGEADLPSWGTKGAPITPAPPFPPRADGTGWKGGSGGFIGHPSPPDVLALGR